MFSLATQEVIRDAIFEVQQRRHQYLTLEHLLYALLFCPFIREILTASSINLSVLQANLEQFFTSKHCPSSKNQRYQSNGMFQSNEQQDAEPKIEDRPNRISRRTTPLDDDLAVVKHKFQQTLAVDRAIAKAWQQTKSAGKKLIEPWDLLLAVFADQNSYAAYYLQKQGLKTYDLVCNISDLVLPVQEGQSASDSEDRTHTFNNANTANQAEKTEEQRQVREPIDRGERRKAQTTDLIEAYTQDLTKAALEGKLDPVFGRETELVRVIEILSRRKKNNPLLVGEPGVGKTAIAEGLAQMLIKPGLPDNLQNAKLLSLDLSLLVAGTRYRGDFEKRIKDLIQALLQLDKVIIFIDEIHNLIGAGATSNATLDAANLLKPILANGSLRCMGATTYEEYRNHFAKDRALARRFQQLTVPEPSPDACLNILKNLAPSYASYHGVEYSDQALDKMLELSLKYFNDRYLPDKAIDLLDESGARLKLKIARDKAGIKDSEKSEATEEVNNLNDKHEEQQTEVQDSLLTTNKEQKEPLSEQMPEQNLVTPRVEAEQIDALVADLANIPLMDLSASEAPRLEHLEQNLANQVFGQEVAIKQLTQAIWRSQAGLKTSSRPEGSFLFYGPTGVGKTELAKALASCLGIEFLRFDMSEYIEQHAVARLIGSPPGYVGFEQGGLLTESVRKKPRAVLLLDEIEKAHPDIYNILLQVMDYATLTDNTGKKTDFKHIILIMTSNAGAFEMQKNNLGFQTFEDKPKVLLQAKDSKKITAAAAKGLKEVERIFSPEFRNRLDGLIPFNSLTEPLILQIVDKFLAELQNVLTPKQVTLDVNMEAKAYLANKGFDQRLGARPLKRLIDSEIADPIAPAILFGELVQGGKVEVSLQDDKLHLQMQKNKLRKTSRKSRAKTSKTAILEEN